MSGIEESAREAWLLPRLWAIFLVVLLAATFRLWVVPTTDAMPGVPLLGQHWNLPRLTLVQTVPSIAIVIGLLLVIVAPVRFRGCWWLVSGGLWAAFLVDQHRLQPWAYQSAIFAAVFASMDSHRGRRWLIPIAASIYLYSAAGKFDYQFAHTVGQDFLEAAARPLGGLPEAISRSMRARLALVLPAIEFAAAVGLLFRPTRAVAAVAVIGMHASLIGILGPWGLDHSTGVLVWNVLLIVQAYHLFLRKPSEQDARSGPARSGVGVRLCQAIVLLALFAPLLERRGYWDHWPSWSLYSPHTSRVQIEIHRSAADLLDPATRSFLADDQRGDGWRELQIGRWSLDSRGAPIYPQARYQLALASKIAARYQLTGQIRALQQGVSDRWTGRRDQTRMLGRAEIEAGLRQFWLTR